MKDKHDENTLDAFGIAKKRGRPVIATPIIKKQQSAKRSRRYRLRQRIINQVARSMATKPEINRGAYLAFLNYLGNSAMDAECDICYEHESGGMNFEKIRFSELVEKYFQLKDIAIVSCDSL